jgi:hypothetical protein
MRWRNRHPMATVGPVTQTTRRSDQDIQADVTEELQHTPSVGAPVEVSVSGGR